VIWQSSREILDKIQKFLGCGHVYANGRTGFKLKISDHIVQAQFIKGLLPYSTVKRDKLGEVQAFIAAKAWNRDKPLRSRHITSEEIALNYNQGISTHALAHEYGVSQVAIHARLKRFGVSMRPLGTNQYSQKRRIVAD
jgi:hypothetical protein